MKYLLALMLGLSCLARAQDQQPDDAQPAAAAATSDSLAHARDQHRLTVKLGYLSNYQYREPAPGVQISGWLPQLSISYVHGEFDLKRPSFWGIDASFASSTLHYSGSVVHFNSDGTIGGTTPFTTSDRDQIATVRGRFGMSFFDSPTQDLNVSVGLALWDLEDDGGSSASYDRQILYLYAPVEVEYMRRFGRWTASADLAFNVFIYGSVTSDLSQADSSLPNMQTDQTSGYGAKLTISGERDFGNWSLVGDVYDQYWNIRNSDSDTVDVGQYSESFYEPANNTNILAFEVGGRF